MAEHVAQLALGLRAHGHEPLVLAPAAFRPAGRLLAAGCALEPLPVPRDYAHPHRDAQALARLTRAARHVDLVHAHSAKAGVLGRLAARAAGRPCVYTPHCFAFVGEVSGARRRFALAAERALAPLTAALICVSEDEREVAAAAGLHPAAVVHNGCPPCAAGDADPLGPGPVVGAVTVLRRQKRVDVLLAAAPAILEAVPEATVAVVGEGPELAALREAADPRVVFAPYRGPAAVKALDVYVLPSAWEAFPIGVLEALACGVPQVATDVGGTREAVTPETGILVPPRDPRALADAVIALLRDPATRERMAAASKARHTAHFTVARMVAETAAVYETVLGG